MMEWRTEGRPPAFRRVMVTLAGSEDESIRWTTVGYRDAEGNWRNIAGYPMIERVVAFAYMEPYRGAV